MEGEVRFVEIDVMIRADLFPLDTQVDTVDRIIFESLSGFPHAFRYVVDAFYELWERQSGDEVFIVHPGFIAEFDGFLF